MGAEHQGARPGVDWKEFKKRIENQGFMDKQDAPLRMRLSLVESFLDGGPGPKLTNNQKKARAKLWDFEPGSLTIVDLSCPYVNENDACALFSICLSLALENRGTGGRIVALDEAHKVCLTSRSLGITSTKAKSENTSSSLNLARLKSSPSNSRPLSASNATWPHAS